MEAVQKWQSSGQSAAAIESELDLSSGSLYRWKNELAAEFESSTVLEPAPERTSKSVPEVAPESEVGPIEDSDVDPDEQSEEAVVLADSKPPSTMEETETAKMAEQEPPLQSSLIKRIAGVIAVILGGIGIILSIAAFEGVWVANAPITDMSVEILDTIDGALEVVEINLGRADTALQTIRDGITEAATSLPI